MLPKRTAVVTQLTHGRGAQTPTKVQVRSPRQRVKYVTLTRAIVTRLTPKGAGGNNPHEGVNCVTQNKGNAGTTDLQTRAVVTQLTPACRTTAPTRGPIVLPNTSAAVIQLTPPGGGQKKPTRGSIVLPKTRAIVAELRLRRGTKTLPRGVNCVTQDEGNGNTIDPGRGSDIPTRGQMCYQRRAQW